MTAQPVLAPPLAGKPVVQHPRTDLARFPAWPRCPIACVPDAVPGLCVARPSANGQGTSTLRPRRARSHRSAHGVRAPRGDENAAALELFIHEYRLTIPIGIDEAQVATSIPLTMQSYQLNGTPSLILIDRLGHVRLNHLGHIDDMALDGLSSGS